MLINTEERRRERSRQRCLINGRVMKSDRNIDGVKQGVIEMIRTYRHIDGFKEEVRNRSVIEMIHTYRQIDS